MTWRDRFRPMIAEVLAAHAGAGEKTLRRALREAWPYTMTRGGAAWPYKVWLDEIARQRGKRKPARKLRRMTAEEAREWMRKRQLPLF
jgi:hypothetical protein